MEITAHISLRLAIGTANAFLVSNAKPESHSVVNGFLAGSCNNALSAAQLLRYFLTPLSKISKLDVSDTVKKEINAFIDDYYDRYTGLYLKSKNFLKKLVNL